MFREKHVDNVDICNNYMALRVKFIFQHKIHVADLQQWKLLLLLEQLI